MIEQGSDDWLEARQSGLGGSEVSVLYGKNPYMTETVLWLSKTGRIPPTKATIHDEPAMYWGTALEKQVRRGYTDLTGRVVEDGVTMLRHPKAPIFANTDGSIPTAEGQRGPGVYEGKIAGGIVRRRDWENEGKVRLPLHYQCQLQTYLECTGCQWGSLAVLFGDRWDLKAIDVVIDRAFIADMLARARSWWKERIELDRPPPVDSSSKTEDALRQVYPRDDGRIVILPDQFAGVLDRLLAAESMASQIDDQVQCMRNMVIAAMGPHAIGLLYDGRGFAMRGADGRKLTKLSVDAMAKRRRAMDRRGAGEPQRVEVHPELQAQADAIAGISWGIKPRGEGSET